MGIKQANKYYRWIHEDYGVNINVKNKILKSDCTQKHILMNTDSNERSKLQAKKTPYHIKVWKQLSG